MTVIVPDSRAALLMSKLLMSNLPAMRSHTARWSRT